MRRWRQPGLHFPEFTDRKTTRVLFINQSEAAALRLRLRDIDDTKEADGRLP